MRHILITLFVLMLAGCASGPGYDKSAGPNATAVLRQATAKCAREQNPTKFTASKFMACRVAAERNFAMAIQLPNKDAFDSYAAQMMALAADYDAGRIYLKRMNDRAASIRSHYLYACNCGLEERVPSFGYDIVPSLNLPPP